jgi:hypothetical protein
LGRVCDWPGAAARDCGSGRVVTLQLVLKVSRLVPAALRRRGGACEARRSVAASASAVSAAVGGGICCSTCGTCGTGTGGGGTGGTVVMAATAALQSWMPAQVRRLPAGRACGGGRVGRTAGSIGSAASGERRMLGVLQESDRVRFGRSRRRLRGRSAAL